MAVSKVNQTSRVKHYPFECGYDRITRPRYTLSLHFYLVAIVFLIFDVEIALLIPLIIAMKATHHTC
jgi:NADH-ubiquinone oxidoreductase chain 3